MGGESVYQGADPAVEFEEQAKAAGLTLPERRRAPIGEVAAIVAVIILISVGIGAATGWMNLSPAGNGPPGLFGPEACSGQAGQRVALTGTLSADSEVLVSSSWTELTERFVGAYGSCVEITYTSSASSSGLGALSSGQAQFAVLTSAPTKSDLSQLPNATFVIPVGLTSVSVVYNVPGVSAAIQLNGSTLAAIYEGTITQWNNPSIAQLNPGLNLPANLPISVVYRSDPTPLNDAFTGFLSASSSRWNASIGQGNQVPWPSGVGEGSAVAAVNRVANESGAIGYVATGTTLQSPVGIAALEDLAGTFVSPTATAVANAAESAFNAGASTIENWTGASLLNAPGNDSYPLSYLSYLVVYHDLGRAFGPKLTLLAAQWQMTFLWWVLSDGGYVTAPLGLDQLPGSVVAPSQLAMEQVAYNGKSILETSEGAESGGETGQF